MKLVKSLLLASATGLVAVSGASAADLGVVKKPAPAEYVRVCNAYGAGFFYIPGTQTCLRVGGRAFMEYQYVDKFDRGNSQTGYRALGRLILDARTQSEYGPVRAFVRIDAARRTGNDRSGTAERIGIAEIPSAAGVDFAGKAQTVVTLDSGFIQFAGFTLGRLQSFFDFYSGPGLISPDYSSITTQTFAYTATFGSGFSATLSIEDAIERRQRVFSASGAVTAAGAIAAVDANGGFTNGALVNNTPGGAGGTGGAFGPLQYGGFNVPDVVGVLRYDQPWGSAQLSAAYHEITYTNTSTATGSAARSADDGYAVQLGVKVNLPMLAAGDTLWLQGAYSSGATSYEASSGCGSGSNFQCAIGGASGLANGLSRSTGNLPLYDSAVVINPVTGATRQSNTQAYGGVASLTHYFTPTINGSIFGSYMRIEYERFTGLPSYEIYRGGVQGVWSPIKDLNFIGEVQYNHASADALYQGNFLTPAALSTFRGLRRDEDQIVSRVRIVRDF